jgi:hypothetical protein
MLCNCHVQFFNNERLDKLLHTIAVMLRFCIQKSPKMIGESDILNKNEERNTAVI